MEGLCGYYPPATVTGAVSGRAPGLPIGQARRVTQLSQALVANRKRFKIQAFAWATWLSPEAGSPYWFHYTGLNRLQFGLVKEKPALKAFRDSVAQLGG